MFEIKKSVRFEKEFSRLPPNIKARFEKKMDLIQKNPTYLGKPLGVRWFREIKVNKLRLYYVIYEDARTILYVNISKKKDQQSVIDTIRKSFGDENLLLQEEKANYLYSENKSIIMDKELKRLREEKDKLMKELILELRKIDEHNGGAKK